MQLSHKTKWHAERHTDNDTRKISEPNGYRQPDSDGGVAS